MSQKTKYFRHHDALIPTVIALTYVITTYILGFGLLLAEPLYANILGIPILAHSMVIAAYLIHEAAHSSVFKDRKHNRWFAEFLLWITGNSYSNFDDIQRKHNRHHSDRADIVSFDFRPILEKYPRLLKVIKTLEWMYIPILEILMHVLVLILPFIKKKRKQNRPRIMVVFALRAPLFIWLATISLHI